MQAYRRALRRPLPAERNYLAAQFVGVGIQFGDLHKTLGGRIVEGPLGGSPAEAAGRQAVPATGAARHRCYFQTVQWTLWQLHHLSVMFHPTAEIETIYCRWHRASLSAIL